MSSPSPARHFQKFIASVFAVLFVIIAVLQLQWFAQSPWMSIRLAPAFQMAKGLPIYPTAEGGPYAATLYGFINPLFYTPITWIRDVDWAVRAGGVWTSLWAVGVGFWLLRRDLQHRVTQGQLQRPEKAFLLALFVLSTWAVASLRYSLLEIHADGPAHLFVFLTCLAVLRYRDQPKAIWLILAGLAAGTAPWAKQFTALSLMGPFIWLWWLRGWKPALIFGLATMLTGLVWLAIGCGLFGSQTLIFNLLTVPAHQPWLLRASGPPIAVTGAGPKLNALAVLFTREIIWDYGPVCLLLVVMGYVIARLPRPPATSFLKAHSTFSLLVLTAICAFPSMPLGLVKEGGDTNSASFFTYPAVLALLVGAGTLAPTWRQQNYLRPLGILTLASCTVLSLAGIGVRLIRRSWPTHRPLQEYIRAHPGELYCPFDPLVHVMEDGTYAPAVDILYSLDLAGYKVTPERFFAALSFAPKVQMIVIHPIAIDSKYMMELFPEHQTLVQVPGLSGYYIYGRSKDTAK